MSHSMVRIQCLGPWVGLRPSLSMFQPYWEGKGRVAGAGGMRFEIEWIFFFLTDSLSHGSIEPWLLFFCLHCSGQFARAAHSPVGWAVIFAARS